MRGEMLPTVVIQLFSLREKALAVYTPELLKSSIHSVWFILPANLILHLQQKLHASAFQDSNLG